MNDGANKYESSMMLKPLQWNKHRHVKSVAERHTSSYNCTAAKNLQVYYGNEGNEF